MYFFYIYMIHETSRVRPSWIKVYTIFAIFTGFLEFGEIGKYLPTYSLHDNIIQIVQLLAYPKHGKMEFHIWMPLKKCAAL